MNSRQKNPRRRCAPWLAATALCLPALPAPQRALTQAGEPNRASLVVRADQPGPIIKRNIYGQFAEHLGRLIYGGLRVGEDSPIPNTRWADPNDERRPTHIPF